MLQLTLSLPDRNGYRSGHEQFSADLRRLLDDLKAAEELRAVELKRLRQLRTEVYAEARRYGVKPQILRAVLSLQGRAP